MRHPENYPLEWKEIAHDIKDANDWQCQECDRQCLRPGEKCADPSERARHTLTVAHAEPNYRDAEIFVMALCAPCHLRYDAAMHVRQRKVNQAKANEDAGQTVMPFAKTLPRKGVFHV